MGDSYFLPELEKAVQDLHFLSGKVWTERIISRRFAVGTSIIRKQIRSDRRHQKSRRRLNPKVSPRQ